jgi:hypothetical protein
MKMAALGSLVVSVLATRRYNPDDSHLPNTDNYCIIDTFE